MTEQDKPLVENKELLQFIAAAGAVGVPYEQAKEIYAEQKARLEAKTKGTTDA